MNYYDAILGLIPLALLVLNELVNVVTTAESSPAEPTDDSPARTTTEDAAASTEGGNPGGIAITRTDLSLTTPVLVAFGGYSGYVAWQDPTALSVGVATATASAALLASGLYYALGRDASPAPTPATDAGVDEDPTPDGGVDVDAE